MDGRVFAVAKKVLYHRNGNIFTMRKWLNDEKQLVFIFRFNYINQYSYLENNFNHLKLRYTDPYNCLTKGTLVSQPCTLVLATDFNISQYLHLSIHSPTIIVPII